MLFSSLTADFWFLGSLQSCRGEDSEPVNWQSWFISRILAKLILRNCGSFLIAVMEEGIFGGSYPAICLEVTSPCGLHVADPLPKLWQGAQDPSGL